MFINFLTISFALSRHCAHILHGNIVLSDSAHPPFFPPPTLLSTHEKIKHGSNVGITHRATIEAPPFRLVLIFFQLS